MLLQSEGADRWWCRLLPLRGGRGGGCQMSPHCVSDALCSPMDDAI
jgi:hypothetical protein